MSSGDDHENYRRQQQMEQRRYWSSPEGSGLVQEEFEELQEQNNRWPISVRIAVDEVFTIANKIDSLTDTEPKVMAENIAELVGPIVQYLEPLIDSQHLQQLEDKRCRADAAGESPWYLEPGISSTVTRWESINSFRRSLANDENAERQERKIQTLESLFHAVASLAEIRDDRNVADSVDSDIGTRVVELAESFKRAWERAKYLDPWH